MKRRKFLKFLGLGSLFGLFVPSIGEANDADDLNEGEYKCVFFYKHNGKPYTLGVGGTIDKDRHSPVNEFDKCKTLMHHRLRVLGDTVMQSWQRST